MTKFSYKDSTRSPGALFAQGSPVSAAPLVLVVEDHEDTRFMLRTILEMRGIRVTEAVDGEEAVRAAEALHPDLVLMDGSLPRLDGLTATRRIREREDGHKVPIVILSGHADPALQVEAFAAGCDAYLVKPLNFDKLDGLLESLISLKESLNCDAT